MPDASCITPNPSEVATPISVPTMATMSIKAPSAPFVRFLPSSDTIAQRMDTGSPLRCTA